MANILLDVKTVDGYKKHIAELKQENERLKEKLYDPCTEAKIINDAIEIGYKQGMQRAAEIPVGYVVPDKDRGDKQAFTAGVMATREEIRARIDKF